MANVKKFLRDLERDDALLAKWRQGSLAERKQLAKDAGADDEEADALASGNLKKVAAAVKKESPGAEVFCVVMVV